MNFRLANINDCDQLDNLLTKLIEDERKYDKSIEKDFKVSNFYKNCIIKNNNLIYLCEVDNSIVGYIYLIIDKDKAKIDALYVEEEYRNRGIASKLLDYAITHFKKNNIKEVEINVLSNNIAAKKLYEKKGFYTFKETMKVEL